MKYINLSVLNKFSIATILVIISIFYFACYHFSYNFFYQDDYHLLRFVTIFQDDSVSLQQKFKALYDLHNEHRIIFPRLIVLLDYYIQGHIDWKILNTISALYYFGIFAFFALIIKKLELSYFFILPVALFIFQPSANQNFYWTISILQQVGNLFWAMFLFYSFMYFQPKYFWVSLVLITVLTFTHGNGLFAFGVGGFLLFFQKRYRDLFIWIVFMIVVATFYFHGYLTAQSSNIIGSLSDPIRLIGCFLGFWGSFIYDFFKENNRTFFAIMGGLVIFFILSVVNIKLILNHFTKKNQTKYEQYFPEENLFLLAVFLYLFITASLVALSRSWSSIEAGFQNRYLHNSVIALILLYATLLHYKSLKFKRDVGIIFLIFGMLFNVFSWYSNYEFLLFQRASQETDAVNYQLNNITIVNDKSFNNNIEQTLNQSFVNGISISPKSNLLTALSKLQTLKSVQFTDCQIDIKKDSLIEFNISNSNYRDIYRFNNFTLPYKGNVYLILKSKNNIFISPTTHRKSAKFFFLRTGQFFTDGFMTPVMTDAMPKNEYQIGILQNIKKRFIYYPTKYKITTR